MESRRGKSRQRRRSNSTGRDREKRQRETTQACPRSWDSPELIELLVIQSWITINIYSLRSNSDYPVNRDELRRKNKLRSMSVSNITIISNRVSNIATISNSATTKFEFIQRVDWRTWVRLCSCLWYSWAQSVSRYAQEKKGKRNLCTQSPKDLNKKKNGPNLCKAFGNALCYANSLIRQ